MRGSFFGGVHPVTRKELTRRKHLTQLDRPPEQVAIPLRMSAGEESVPLVKPGDLVEVGQPIAGPGPGRRGCPCQRIRPGFGDPGTAPPLGRTVGGGGDP